MQNDRRDIQVQAGLDVPSDDGQPNCKHDHVEALLKQHASTIRAKIERDLPRRLTTVLTADDVMQESYLDAFLDLSTFEDRGDGAFEAWFGRIARNNMLNAIQSLEADRRGGKQRRVEARDSECSLVDLYDSVLAETKTPSRIVARREAIEAVRSALERLNPADRRLIELHFLQGIPIKEIAATLGVREGKLHMRRARAVKMLGRLVGRPGDFLTCAG